MEEKELLEAVQIIADHHGTKMSINECVNGHISHVYPLLIHECCPAVINELIAAGYTVSMVAKGLSVEKY